MSAIQNLFQQAQLAEATYANFWDSNLNVLITNSEDVKGALQDSANNSRFSQSQAAAFVAQWRVVDQYTAPFTLGVIGTGFSATLFQNIETGVYAFSLRGTNDVAADVFGADLGDIVADGIALDQVVDLYNYWQSLTHTGTYEAKQLVTMTTETAALNAAYFSSSLSGLAYETTLRARADIVIDYPSRTVRTIQSVDSSQLSDLRLRIGADKLTAATSVDVDGHSLGGHLAMAFSRLFPGATANVTAVNGAGFNFANTNVSNLFAMLGGASDFDENKIINVIGSAALNVVSQDWLFLQQPAGQQEIYTESFGRGTTVGHGAGQMTDSLAIYDLFARLDPALNVTDPAAGIGKITDIIKAASHQSKDTLERTVNSLINFFGLNFPPLVNGLVGDREALYERIVLLQALTTGVSTNNPGAHVDVLTTATAQNLALLASGSEALAYRYALKALNPFAVVGDNSLYAIHNQKGELNLYDPAQKTGSLTEAWLTERAKLLHAVLLRNTQDNPDIAVIPVVDNREVEYRYYENGTERVLFAQAVNRTPGALPTELVQFADNTGRYLNGSDNVLGDKLFGGDSADIIEGRGGQDYLEGGRGMDLYTYNRTRRNGIFGSTVDGDGTDTVLDTDGKGVLRIVKTTTSIGLVSGVEASVAIDASVRLNETTWQSADGKFNYVKAGTDLVVVINDEGGGTVTLKNWNEGDFGIHLLDALRTAPQTTTEILGDKKYLDISGQQVQRKLPNGDPISFTEPDGSGAVYERLSDALPNNWLNARLAPGSGYTLWQTSGGISYYILPITLNLLYNEADDFGNIKHTDEDQPDLADQLYDTPGNDNIISGGGNDNIDALRSGNDVIDAGVGRDVVNAGIGNDLVEGGADGTVVLGISGAVVGGDMVAGGAGDDEIYGNTKIALSLAIKNGEMDVATNAIGDFLSGEAGNDWMVGGKGSDALLGGDGDDILVGGTGNDNLYGDRNHTAPDASWLITRQVGGSASSGFTYQTLFTGINVIADGAGGRDVLYGGAGVDWAFGGKGDDFIDGGSGMDVLFGDEGSDVVIGGAEDDILAGDGATIAFEQQGDDFLDGGAGKDHLFGYGGSDVLIGDAGDDILSGGEGNDILIGGTGLDQLFGGSGKDTYVFNRGDGTEIIVDTAGDAKSPDASVVVLGDGISRSNIKFRKGSLLVDLGPSNPDDPLAGSDQIHFLDFNSDFPELTAAIGEIRFADGTSMDYADILAQGFDIDGTAFDDAGGTALTGTSVTDRIRGFAGSDELEGRDGNDVLTGDGGSDRLDAGNGNDLLDGGAGNDFLAGGMGSDDYRFIRGDGVDTLIEGSLFVPGLPDPAGTDRIVFGGDITRSDVSLFRSADGDLIVRYGAGDEIRVEGQYGVTGSDIESIAFADSQIIAKAELDALETGVVQGTADADELSGTAGNDVLNGGAGSDTYALYWGMGNDRIIDAADGQTNTLMLLDDATLESVQTSRNGDDLRVAIRGGGGSVTVQGFFTDGSASAWQIADTMEGSRSLLDFHVAQGAADNAPVIDAMQDYQQQLLGEWRAQGQSGSDLPTQVYVHSTWSQTTSTWRTLVPALPEPVLQTITFVNDPVEHSTIKGYGYRQGNHVIELPVSGNTVFQRFTGASIEEQVSDAAIISMQNSGGDFTESASYSFFAGGGGPFGNERTYQTVSGTLTNTIVESSVEGWVPLTLREDNLGNFQLNVQRTFAELVIEKITAGAGNNTISGAIENSSDTVALIDAGAGDDAVAAGNHDFVFGNDGDDELNGGARAFGGDGHDSLFGGKFMSGGAGDDYLGGGEGETTFHFRSDEVGWDWVEDQNGISLNEFAVQAGIADSRSNLLYGGKYRYLDSDFSLSNAFSDWALRNPGWQGFATESSGDEHWPVPDSSGFPRGVQDEFARELAPAWGDGYYSWVYNSVEDMMRDFADLGLHFNPEEVRQVPGVPEMSDFTADNHRALEPFFESGVLEKDVVELADFQAGVDELKIGFAPPDEYDDVNRLLRLVWGEDKVIDIELPSATDLIGHGIEEVRYGGDSVYIGDFVDIAREEGFLGTPYDDVLPGTAGDDRIRGLGGQDLIESGTGNDTLSGGTGGDTYFFNAGDGADTIIDAAEDGQANRVVLRDYLASDITGFRDGEYVVLQANGTGDAVRMLWDQAAGTGVDLVEFADGATWDRAFLDQLAGTAVNSPPVVAIPIGAIATAEDTGLDFAVPADTFQDADAGDVLTYTAALADGGALPSWLSFDVETRMFSGTPLEADVGTISVRVTVTDTSDATASDVFNLTVLNTNDAPVLAAALADQSAVEDQAFSFAIPAGAFTDEDAGDPLAYTATLGNGAALPEWLTFDDATHTFSGVPANEDTGTLSIRVTATDGDGASVSDTFAITVAGANDTPELNNPLPDQAVTAGTLFNYVVPVTTFVDIDAGDSVTLSARLSGGAALPSWLAFDAASGTFSGTFNGIPPASNVGVLNVEVTATDASGASANDQFVLTINPAPGLMLTGTAAADTLTGGYGNDVIDGLAGADQMSGGDGDDSYVVDHVNDAVLENPAQGHDTVLSSVTHTLVTEVEDLVLTGTANRNGTGNDLANTITGNAGVNRLDGGAGADILIGGLGNDIYIIDNALDAAFEASGAGIDTVQSSITAMLSANIENLTLTGEAAIDGTGNELANTITGNAAANTLSGGAGNDRLTGGAGVDTLVGGTGNDTYIIDLIDEFIIEQAGEGTDTVHSPVDFTLADHFENLTLTGDAISGTGNAAANRLTGNALANVLSGLDGNDILDGKAGADTLIGGIGNDTYIIDDGADVTVELTGEGTDTVQATASYALGTEIERLTLTGSAEINGTGNALDNRLTGNAAINTLAGLEGNDTLDGKAGADTLIGGAGNDSYVVDNSDDVIVELADDGIDAVASSATYTLAANVENLTLSGSAALDGTGNDLGNRLTGNAAANVFSGLGGNDILDGKAGADTLIGGTGDDLYIIDNAGDVVGETSNAGIDTVQAALAWTLGDHVENLTLTGAAAIDGVGNSGDNILTGNNAANVLTGLAGNDTLDGKGGIDTLIGGAGDDIYVVNHANDVIMELAGEGTDTVRSSTTRTLGAELEHLTLTGAGNISATGNALDNVITGNAGNNTLDGGMGADVMAGGLGNDTYMVDDSGDAVIEAAGSGVDAVKTGMAYTLTANVENLTLTGTTAAAATGNELANVLIGNNAANTLNGLDGNDVLDGKAGGDAMTGGAGDDVYTVDNAGDTVTELADEGTDTVRSSLTYTLGDHVENLALTGNANRHGTGNALDNILTGNNGANTLNGLAGDDALAGGLGGDTYRFDLNFGHDVIAENDATTGNLDRVVFGAGIAVADITLGRLNDDLVAHTADQQHSIQMLNWFTADAHKVERIEFADGTMWDQSAINTAAMRTVDMPGLLRGDDQVSTLLGQIGNTVLEGAGGGDTLIDIDGNNIFSGGDGDDAATGGAGNDLFIGGTGNDTLTTGAGNNVIAYNAGGGVDTVYADAGANNMLSLGGGLGYSDLSLSRNDNDLVLNTGTEDQIIFKDWYAGRNNLLNLQLILDATDEFDANSANPLLNRRVQNFDFLGLVNDFDAAQTTNPGLTRWALSDALMQYHLSGSDDAALGGDLAYWYARNDGLTGISLSAAQGVIGASGFGSDAQSLRPFSGLQEGLVRLG